MKHLRSTLSLTLALFALTLTARPCGPDFPEAIFVLQTGPGGNYASYAAGRIGIPQKSYRTRHMVVAYDYLNGHALPANVQQQAIAVNRYLQDPWQADSDSAKSQPGYGAWASARSGFGPVDGTLPGPVVADRSIPGEDYDTFTNCLDDAFGTAARTLAARIAAHGAQDAAVTDWVRAQDAVFTNCSDGKVSRYYGPPDKAPPPPPQPRAPLAAPAGAPLWLRQDRAYQQAAASFYHLDFDDAARQFRAVAAETGSPWSATARYLVARSYLRKASLSDPAAGGTGGNDPAKQQAASARVKADLALAQHELVAMQAESRMTFMRHAIDGLLDYTNVRLQPGAQAAVLAARLQTPNAASFQQAVLDLTWLHSTHDYDDRPVPSLNSAAHPDDMLAWIDAMYGADEASALTHWRSTHTAAWLVAAMSYAKPGDAAVPEMLQAARSVTQSSPGWLAVTYNRLRLSPRTAATRSEVLALLPQIRQSGDTSTINLFLALSTATAPGLEEWLASVGRTPAGFGSSDGEEDTQAETLVPATAAKDGTPPPTVEDVCGTKFPAGTVLPLFDTDAAAVFNREMPLRLLARAAESSALPAGLRFQVAQAAWTRAVLLDRPDVARRMTPLLIGCRVAWTPVLTAYDGANAPDARHASGLLALMRFASTVPSVWDGEDRRSGFATYDDYRQNWWCTTVPRPGDSVDADPDMKQTAQETSRRSVTAVPPFLTPADRDEARTEVAALQGIPRASTYFAQQALTWQKLHPADPQTVEILGQADRVVRNACRKDPPYEAQGQAKPNPADMTLTSNLAKALFDTLHRNYPDSAWAKRYKSWQ